MLSGASGVGLEGVGGAGQGSRAYAGSLIHGWEEGRG